MNTYLEFEKPIIELDKRIIELQNLNQENGSSDIGSEISKLNLKASSILQEIYNGLSPWQKTQVARHPERPHFSHFVSKLIDDFCPLAGDRHLAEDYAVVGGFGRFRGESILIIGNEKGDNTESRVHHNFGMARPEGYRKAMRLMKMADHFQIPIVTIIDTPGAYPGVGAEERGQAEAIARSIECCLSLGVPMVVVIVGEGGSGGAIALATGNRVLMLEHAIYSVISPEGCASILWRDPSMAPVAAKALKLTAEDLKKFNIIDEIVKEPIGGAHRDHDSIISEVGESIERSLQLLSNQDSKELKRSKYEKFLQMGQNSFFNTNTNYHDILSGEVITKKSFVSIFFDYMRKNRTMRYFIILLCAIILCLLIYLV